MLRWLRSLGYALVLGWIGAGGCAGQVTSEPQGVGGVMLSGGMATTGGVTLGGRKVGGVMPTGGTAAGGFVVMTGGVRSLTGGTPSSVVACSGLPYPAAVAGNCTGAPRPAEQPKLDLYLMLDRTQSMTNPTSTSTRWSELADAIGAFLIDPEAKAQDLRVGIQFFSISGGFDHTADCNPALYATPAVEMGPVGTSGPEILAAIQRTTPSGQTPSVAALQGAVQHAIAWQAANPTRQTIVLFITDGFPTMCNDQSDASLVAAAQMGMSSPLPIRTYVIGMSVGANVFRLRDLAAYGGSGAPYLVDDTNARQGLIDALRNIAQGALPCQYPIPDPPVPELRNYDRLQVVHTTASGTQEEIPYANSLGWCSQAYGGWYYDVDPTRGMPTAIRVCPCTCLTLGAGTIDFYFGCPPHGTGLG